MSWNRTLLFYGVCIPIRLLIAASPLIVPLAKHWILVSLFGGISASFFILWVSNARLNAPEASTTLKLKSAIPLFTQGTWWANGRIVHALLYGFAALCLLSVTKHILSMLVSTITNKISAGTSSDKAELNKSFWAYFPSAHIIASVILLTDVVFGGIYRWLVVG